MGPLRDRSCLIGLVCNRLGKVPRAHVAHRTIALHEIRLRCRGLGLQFRLKIVIDVHMDDVIVQTDKHHAVTEQSYTTELAVRLNATDARKQLKSIVCEAWGKAAERLFRVATDNVADCSYSAACAGTMVTLSPQPHASVWFGLRNVNLECIGETS